MMRRSFLHPGTLDARRTFSQFVSSEPRKRQTAPGNDWVAVVPAQDRLDGVKAGRASLGWVVVAPKQATMWASDNSVSLRAMPASVSKLGCKKPW